MNLKKFISGVSAFAIAASAFAATASAETHEISQAVYGTVAGSVTSNSDGTYAVSSTSVGGVIADLSAIDGLDEATSVTVQFDTNLPTVTSGGKTYIASVMYGVGDKAVRGTDENGSASAGSYVKEGLVAYFGSENGKNYYVNGDTSQDWTSSVKNKDVRATITLDRTTGEYSGNVALSSSAKVPFSGTVAVGTNLNVIEVYTRGLSGYTFTFKNIKVTYTTPDAPAPVSVDLDVTNQEAFTGTGDSKAVIVNSAISGVDTIDTLTITADGTEKTFTNGTDFDFSTNFGGSDAVIAVIVNNVSEVTAIAIN